MFVWSRSLNCSEIRFVAQWWRDTHSCTQSATVHLEKTNCVDIGQGCPKFLPRGPHVARRISVGPHLTTILAAWCILFILLIKPCGPIKIWSRATFGPRAGLWMAWYRHSLCRVYKTKWKNLVFFSSNFNVYETINQDTNQLLLLQLVNLHHKQCCALP